MLRKTGKIHVHKEVTMDSTILTLMGVSAIAGAIISAYVTTKVLAFRTRKKRRAREKALRDIASHKWDTGDHSDAVVVTRIALRGLAGE